MNEQVQQMMALAAQQQGQQQAVDVGACGPMMAGAGNALYGAGMAGAPVGFGCGVQPIQAANPIQDCGVWSQCPVPLSVEFSVNAAGDIAPIGGPGSFTGVLPKTFFFFMERGVFQTWYMKSFTAPGAVLLTSIQTGDLDCNQLAGPCDVACFNTDGCGCPINIGCFGTSNGLAIQARANPLNTGFADVRLCLWGQRLQSFNTCNTPSYCPPPGYGAMQQGMMPAGYGNGQLPGG